MIWYRFKSNNRRALRVSVTLRGRYAIALTNIRSDDLGPICFDIWHAARPLCNRALRFDAWPLIIVARAKKPSRKGALPTFVMEVARSAAFHVRWLGAALRPDNAARRSAATLIIFCWRHEAVFTRWLDNL